MKLKKSQNQKDHNENIFNSRRAFLKKATLTAGAILIAPALKFKSALSFADGLKKLSENDPMAQALGYKANASKVDTKKWPKRAGVEGKKQFCDNCMFYTSHDKSSGKCQIFANKLVAAKGWCNSWAKKA